MTAYAAAERLVQSLFANPQLKRRLFAADTRALRELEQGEDVYFLLANRIPQVVTDLFGESTHAAIRRMSDVWTVSRPDVEALVDLLESGKIIGSHDELIRRKAGGGLGRLLESDHIIEQRIHRMYRAGTDGLHARSAATELSAAERAAAREVIPDSLAVLVPANEVVAYRMARELKSSRRLRGLLSATPWYYVHQGLGSKTMEMAKLVPYGCEAEYSLQEVLDATRWVTTYRNRLPNRAELDALIRDDLVETVMHGFRDDEAFAELAARTYFPGQRRTPGVEELGDAVRSRLSVGQLDLAQFHPPRWDVRPQRYGMVDIQVQSAREVDRIVQTVASR